MQFLDILGQEHIKEYCRRAIETGKVGHAYIISGAKSSGKMMLAEAFATMLMCENAREDSCGECVSCKKADHHNHPDIVYITHEKPGVISVDEIREQLVNDIVTKPYESRYKIYIVDEAEKLNIQAQNALLKTIEEPPEYGIIMLLTTNAESFLPTIKSRCISLSTRPMSDEVIASYLSAKEGISDYEASICAAFAQGAVGAAVKLASSEDFGELKDEVLQLVGRIQDIEAYEMGQAVARISKYKLTISDYLDLMQVWYRDVLMYKATGDANLLIFKEEVYNIKRAAESCSYRGMEEIILAIDKAKTRLNASVNFDLTIELLLAALKENS